MNNKRTNCKRLSAGKCVRALRRASNNCSDRVNTNVGVNETCNSKAIPSQMCPSIVACKAEDNGSNKNKHNNDKNNNTGCENNGVKTLTPAIVSKRCK